MNFVVLVVLGNFAIISAAELRSENNAGVPREQLFQRDGGIKLGTETITNDKFLEQKIIPVQSWNPPSKNVEELYFNQKAMQDFNKELLEARSFTDTDIIMMNRWHGLEDQQNIWEADMILSTKQRAMYTKQGKIFGNTEHLMPNFSQPWPGGEVQYYFENEGGEDVFGDLQLAMTVWEQALGCVKFKLTNVEALSQTTSKRPAPANLEYADLTETPTSPKGVSAAPSDSRSSSSSSSSRSNSSEPPASDLSGTSHLLRVSAGDGCYASVGWKPWSQIVISERCSLGVLVHLLGHVLGLPHEHSRPDRTFHVHLHTQNVRTRDFLFLNTAGGGGAQCSNSSDGWYDIRSVMHLDPYGLSANNLSSLSAHQFADTAYMGASWRRPSYNDVLRLRSTYGCSSRVSTDCEAAPPCVGRLGPGCACTPAEGCTAQPPPGGCSADLPLPSPEAPAQQLKPAAVLRRGRACAWRLRASTACGRVRLTLRLRMEAEVRVAATALGCAPLQVEMLDVDPMDGGRNVSSVICLSDFTRWRPDGEGSWLAHKEVISASPQLRVLVKRYPATSPALARVLQSFEAHLESVVDKFCHCKLAG